MGAIVGAIVGAFIPYLALISPAGFLLLSREGGARAVVGRTTRTGVASATFVEATANTEANKGVKICFMVVFDRVKILVSMCCCN